MFDRDCSWSIVEESWKIVEAVGKEEGDHLLTYDDIMHLYQIIGM